jgi:hypothetical protein
MTSDKEFTRRLIGFVHAPKKRRKSSAGFEPVTPHVKVVFAILSSFKASEKLR